MRYCSLPSAVILPVRSENQFRHLVEASLPGVKPVSLASDDVDAFASAIFNGEGWDRKW